jgi:hypothetical protein
MSWDPVCTDRIPTVSQREGWVHGTRLCLVGTVGREILLKPALSRAIDCTSFHGLNVLLNDFITNSSNLVYAAIILEKLTVDKLVKKFLVT